MSGDGSREEEKVYLYVENRVVMSRINDIGILELYAAITPTSQNSNMFV